MYCLDSSAIIEIFCNSEEGKTISSLIDNYPTRVTSFSIFELLREMKKHEEEAIEKFFKEAEVIEFDYQAAIKSFEIEKKLKSEGNLINITDIFIAGTCLSKGLILVTCDKDFSKIKGLTIKLVGK